MCAGMGQCNAHCKTLGMKALYKMHHLPFMLLFTSKQTHKQNGVDGGGNNAGLPNKGVKRQVK